jgi:rod shape determining protein RodA
MFNFKILKNLDFGLLLIVLLLFSFGVVMIASATDFVDDGISRQVKIQVLAFIVGVILLFLMLLIDYNTLGDFYKFIYVFSIIFLLTVYIPGLGVERFGAKSWISLGPIDIQTSEIAKIGFILSFAKFLEKRYDDSWTVKDLIMCGLFIAPFVIFLLIQPDLGSALVFIFISFGMMFSAGLPYKVIGIGGIAGGISLPLIYKFMKPHQRLRIDAFLNPNDPSLPGNYHVMQSKITIGSGEVLGRGIFQGVYHRYDYLPVQESDFIYAVIGEETGFVGGIIVITLYFFMLSKMLKISKKSKDVYGALIAVGITFMFAFQIIENIGMTMGIMPVTGITLPFLSSGGSSLITSLASVGIILNVYMRRKRNSFNL